MAKKVRSVEIQAVKNGDGGMMHKVTAHFHSTPGKTGKGFGATMGQYHEPQETYHTSKQKAKKHVDQLIAQMTANPNDDPAQNDKEDVE